MEEIFELKDLTKQDIYKDEIRHREYKSRRRFFETRLETLQSSKDSTQQDLTIVEKLR